MITQADFSKQQWLAKDGFVLPYRLRIPEGDGPFPLLVCMHGAGERGVDNESQIGHFLPIFNHPNSPAVNAITVMPQCPDTMRWVEYNWDKGSYQSETAPVSVAFTAAEELIAHLMETLPIDQSRIYITGLSMGGFATWRMLACHPDIFAAGIPVCGGGPLDQAEILATVPIRTFHCADDDVVPPKASRDIVAAIQTVHPNQAEYTEFPTGGHGAWEPVYNDAAQIDWLFSKIK